MSAQDTPDPAADPTADPQMYRRQSAINLARRLGRTRTATNLLDRWKNFTDTPSAGADFNDPNFDMSTAQSLRGVLSRGRGPNAAPGPIRPGVFANKLNTLRQQNTDKAGQDYFNNEYTPALEKAQGVAEGFVNDPVYSATDIANRQGQIASTIRSSLERNLRTAGSTLGIRGMMNPSSPASTAVLARMQQQADSELADSLSSFGLNVSALERAHQMQGAQALTGIAGQRLAAFANIHDPSKLIELNDQLGGLLESLRVQHDAEEAAKAAERGVGRDWLGMGVNLAGQALGAASGMGAFGGGAARGLTPGISPVTNAPETPSFWDRIGR